jgi:hypothetical protein
VHDIIYREENKMNMTNVDRGQISVCIKINTRRYSGEIIGFSVLSVSWIERVEASRYLDSGDSGMYLKRPVGWWIGPPKRRVAWGVRYAARGGMALLLLLGLLANFTVIGSVEPFGIVPFNS